MCGEPNGNAVFDYPQGAQPHFGTGSQALKYYGAFVDDWKNADPELQPVVTTVKKRMAELAAKEGH